MARVRRRDTSAERQLRSLLWARGLRYRVQGETPVGRPDAVFPGPKLAVFVDGCFWHGCPAHYTLPLTRPQFWLAKLRRNVDRDRRQTRELERLGWRVIRLWAHEVLVEPEPAVERIVRAVRQSRITKRTEWRIARVEVLPGERERLHLESLRGKASRIADRSRRGRSKKINHRGAAGSQVDRR